MAMTQYQKNTTFHKTTEHLDSIEKTLLLPLKSRINSFSEYLLHLIDEKGFTDSDCYKKALIGKSHFNKIKNDPDYHVKKNTVLALALALELNEQETDDLLAKAGYALSVSKKTDIVVGYCITRKIYNVVDVNDLLSRFGEPMLTSMQ